MATKSGAKSDAREHAITAWAILAIMAVSFAAHPQPERAPRTGLSLERASMRRTEPPTALQHTARSQRNDGAI